MNCREYKNYSAFDVISMLTCVIDNNEKYVMMINADNSQIVITRQIYDKADKLR